MEQRRVIQVQTSSRVTVQRTVIVRASPTPPQPQVALMATRDGKLVLVRREPEPDPAEVFAKAILLKAAIEAKKKEEEEKRKRAIVGGLLLAALLNGGNDDDDDE